MAITAPDASETPPPESSLFAPARARRRERVLLLDYLPELAEGLSARAMAQLVRLAVAPVVRLERGRWDPELRPGRPRGRALGLLVLEGILSRTVVIDARSACELIGPGDLVDPYADALAVESLAASTEWRTLEPASLAILDEGFVSTAGRSPHLLRALLARSMERTRHVGLQLTITRARRAEDRLLQLFLHAGDRWGRVTPDGIVVPLRVTHRMLGELVGLRRPTVTTALRQLAGEGELVRRFDGTWLLGPRRT